jgi:hypothetical protein
MPQRHNRLLVLPFDIGYNKQERPAPRLGKASVC